MAGTVRWNKTTTPAGPDGWNLTPDVGKALESVNAVVPVANQAERDGLAPPLGKYPGMVVSRADLNGLLEVWDGALWQRGSGSTTPAAGAGWSLAGTLVRTRSTAGTQVAAAFMCTYSGGAFALGTGFIKALTLNNPGYIPTADVFGYVLVLSSTNVVRADGAFNINPVGELYIRMFNGTYTIQPTDKFYISANWNA